MPKIKRTKSTPVWAGPEKDGITYSLLSRYLVCKERFRLLVVEGLKPMDTFSHRVEYGNMWHICEEGQAWEQKLVGYCKELCHKYPTQQEQIEKWYQVCRVQYPIYLDYWASHPDVKNRKVLLPEHTFDVLYPLPSGRIVRLRGKWDSVDLIGRGKRAGIYLQENKTRGDINEGQMKQQLSFDLQTMLYLVALSSPKPCFEAKYPIKGVRYNVVRRPLSGGKGSIRPHKATKSKPAETPQQFYERLGGIVGADCGHYFMRWKVEVIRQDIQQFTHQCFNPVLENLCDDWEWWQWCKQHDHDPYDCQDFYFYGRHNARYSYFPQHLPRHFRFPYGVYNVLAEGGMGELDEYMATGSTLGLHRVKNLFKELT